MVRKTILVIGLMLLTACGGNIPSVKTLADQNNSTQTDSDHNDFYLIGLGDVLLIDVWKEPELSREVTVRLDGNITIPLLNDVKAVGLTCAQLRTYLTKKYDEYVEFPTVSVTLVECRSKRIYLLGAVTSPGEYALVKNMTVVQAISLAGGLADWADNSDIRLIRKLDGTEQHFRVDYDAIVTGKDVSQNVLLQPDDTIYVPR